MTMTMNPPMTHPPSNQFLATLQKHRSGGMLADASQKLAELTAAVHATGKRGKLTIQLSVVPASAGESCITLHDVIEAKIPRQPAPASLWFTTSDGELLKENPAQAEMGPVVVGAESQNRPANAVAPVAIAVNQ